MGKASLLAGALLSLLAMSACNSVNMAGGLHTIDHRVPHVSTVPANQGEPVQIFVREKVSSSESPKPRPVVLMVHGGVSPSTLAFDVDHEQYGWRSLRALDSMSLRWT
jgi:hypothetical protein